MLPKQLMKILEEGSSLNQPPWPEWNDARVNNTQWVGKTIHKSAGSTTSHPRTIEETDLFEDPAGLVELPEDIKVKSWKRPHHLDPTAHIVLEPDSTPLDLLTHNNHLLDYKIMRTIIASVACLEREAFHRPFPVEFQSEQFVPTGGAEWKPWHHVYSLTGVGKGQVHSLQYNHYGKYIVRLFYLGKWRCVMVDDWMPVGKSGKLLLPVSSPNNLWLPLLTKALLRVAALSWQTGWHTVDFSVVHLLTGWIPTSVPCKDCSEYQLWCVCCQLLSTTEEVLLSPGCCEGDQTCSCPRDSELSSVDSRVIFGFVMHPVITRPRQETGLSVTSLENMLLIANVRYNSERPDPMWKEYRWKDWAFQNGIIKDIEIKPLRCVQIYNPLGISSLPSDIQVDGVDVNEYWIDFSILISYTRSFEVYYKPSYFKYSLRAWSVPELLMNPHCAEDVPNSNRGRKPSLEKGGKRNSTSKSKSKSPKKPEKDEKAKSESKPKTSKGTDKGEKGKSVKVKERYVSITERPKSLITPDFFYLLVDSMTCKQMYFCLSAYDSHRPTYGKIFIGKFYWHSPTVAPVVFTLNTFATKGVNITLSPGLHAFRIWHSVPENFCLQIFSNTLFSIGSKMSIQQVLTSDSVSYEYYGKEISCAFEQLLEMPEGGAQHGKAYDHLMSCLQPTKQSQMNTQTLEVFEECLVEMLVESSQFPAEVYQTLQAFQMLFLNPVFGEKTLAKTKNEYYEYFKDRRRSKREKEILLEQELKEKMAQASENKSKGKSGKSDKLTKKSGDSPKKEVEPSMKSGKTGKTGKEKGEGKGKSKPASEGVQLRKLLQCKEKSLLIGDYNQAVLLLKKMMAKAPKLRQFYPFRHEDDYKLVYKDYEGEFQVREPWVALVRCVLNLHSSEEVPCSLHIWSPIDKLVLRLINNDTEKDVPLGFVENSVAYLSRNQEGYTLCVYGVANSETVQWRLRSMGVRQTDLLHVCQGYLCHNTDTQFPEQSQQSLCGFYIPNKDRLIARCLLDVSIDVTVLLKMELSNPYAFCSFTITDELGNLVENTTGVGHIIIPILKLKGKENAWMNSSRDSRTSNLAHTYLVEVKLQDNSWPLSADQTSAAIYYKEHLPHIHYNEQLDKRSSKSSQHSFDDPEYAFFKQVDKPSWTMTVVADLQKEMPVKLRHDTSLFDCLQELKTQWLDEGTDLDHCQQLREEFRQKLADDGEEDWSEEAVFHLQAKRTDILTELYGQRIDSPDTESETSLAIPSSRQSLTASLTMTVIADSLIGSFVDLESSAEVAQKLSHISSTSQKLPASSSSMAMTAEEEAMTVQIDHSDVMVQQSGIHRALENVRLKTMEKLQALYEETALMRTKILNDMKTAKEMELNKEKGKADGPKGRKTSGTPPEKSKGKTSLKDSKKPKSTKGKLK